MIKLTFAGILLILSLTGAAYFYLPDSQPPTTAASQPQPPQQPPPPRPGGGRRYRESEKMPLQIALFGLGGTSFYLWIVNSNLDEMGRN